MHFTPSQPLVTVQGYFYNTSLTTHWKFPSLKCSDGVWLRRAKRALGGLGVVWVLVYTCVLFVVGSVLSTIFGQWLDLICKSNNHNLLISQIVMKMRREISWSVIRVELVHPSSSKKGLVLISSQGRDFLSLGWTRGSDPIITTYTTICTLWFNNRFNKSHLSVCQIVFAIKENVISNQREPCESLRFCESK